MIGFTMKKLLILSAFLGAASVLSAADRYVSLAGTNDFANKFITWSGAATNLEWAVNAALAGETVWVSNGTYYLTNQITIANLILRSWPDGISRRNATIVNGNYPFYTNRCFVLNDAAALVEGFTITNAFRIHDANQFSGGGGVFMTAGTLRNCLITGNSITNGQGGGVAARFANTIITNCDLIGNAVHGNSTVSTGRGGGAALIQGAQIWNSRIKQNLAWSRYMYDGGGGVYGGVIYNSEVVSNIAYEFGGGVCTPTLMRNCLVAENTSFGTGDRGGGGCAYYAGTGFQVDSCTIVSNRGRWAGGIYFFGNGSVFVTNSIVFSNVTDASVSCNMNRHTAYGSTVTCDCACTTNALNVIFIGSGNITNQAPMFADFLNRNYRLYPHSPCVNAGINQSWMNGALDLDNRNRIDKFSARADMGCYELHPRGMMFKVK